MAKKDTQRGLPAPKEKGDAFTRIAKYMTGGSITLTSAEETILNRWTQVDALMRQNKLTTDELVAHIKQTFIVSDWTALGDIKNTQRLFGMARVINKRYVGHIHLERINRDIEEIRDRIFWEWDDELNVKKSRMPDAKEMAALAKMHQVYTETWDAMPEQERADAMPPPKFVFNLVGAGIAASTTLDDALAQADAIITGGGEILDFEEITPIGDDEQ